MNLRPYQTEAVRRALSALIFDGPRALVAMAPGTGQSHVTAAVVATLARGTSVLVIARTAAHVAQWSRIVADHLPHTAIQAPVSVRELLQAASAHHSCVVVTTYRCVDLAEDEDPDVVGRFGAFVLLDCEGAPGERAATLPGIVVGATSFPNSDTLAAFGLSSPTFAYSYQRAVADGYLLDTIVESFDLGSELSSLDEGLRQALTNPDPAGPAWLAAAADVLSRRALSTGDRGKTIVLTRETRQATRLRALLERRLGLGQVAQLTSDQVDVRAAFQSFANEHLPRIAIITRPSPGFAVPAVDTIAVLRPVRSQQAAMRVASLGTRMAEDKTHATVLDFTGTFPQTLQES